MKKFLLALALVLGLGAVPALAASANFYVDGGCTNNGDGLTCDGTHKLGDTECDTIAGWVCAATVGGAGPANSAVTGIGLLNPGATDDQIVIIAGSHAKTDHTSSTDHATGTFDGRYMDTHSINLTNAGHSGHPTIVEGLGYTTLGAGTEQDAWLDASTTVTPTRCSDCTTGICSGASTAPVCTDIWYATVAAGGCSDPTLYYGGTYLDGSGNVKWLKRGASTADLATQYNGLASSFDSNYFLMNLGSSAPTKLTLIRGRCNIINNKSDYHTFRGINMQAGARAFVEDDYIVGSPRSGMTIQDCHFRYSYDRGEGSSRMITLGSHTGFLIENNILEYGSSEPLHFDTIAGSHTVSGIIRNNYIHEFAVGPCGLGCGGTPNCTTFGGQTGYYSAEDYSGFEFYGNVLDGCTGYGLLVEANSDGQQIHDNFITRAGDCFRFNNEGYPQTNAKVYNNICVSPGRNLPEMKPFESNYEGDCFRFKGSSSLLDGHTIDNNVCYNPFAWGLKQEVTNPSNTVFRNNIFASSETKRMVDWSTIGSTNQFTHNIVRSGYNCDDPNASVCKNADLINWAGQGYSCYTLWKIGSRDQCADPLFINTATSDFRLQPYSPGIDAGSTVTPRTAGMSNTVAYTYSFPSMAEGVPLVGAGWDIGAFEERVMRPGFEYGGYGPASLIWATSNEACSVKGAGITDSSFATAGPRHGRSVGSIQGSNVGDECGSLSQTITGLDTSKTYSITGFYVADGSTSTKKLRVEIDGVEKCAVYGDTTSWTAFPACTFTPAGTTAEFKLEVASPASPVSFNIDDLSIRVTN